jgi:hypothetical protein
VASIAMGVFGRIFLGPDFWLCVVIRIYPSRNLNISRYPSINIITGLVLHPWGKWHQ